MPDLCPSCGSEYKSIGNHWQHNPDHRPDLTDKQKDVAIGFLMGDGCISKTSQNSSLQSNMISKNYLKYLDKLFGIFGNGVSLVKTAEENAERNRQTGFSSNAEAENYSDLYRWTTKVHPFFNYLHSWYSSGKKVWPEDIELTPTVLKHWYCCDGFWNNNFSSNHISISIANEYENTDKVSKYFENVGLPTPSNYTDGKTKNGFVKCSAQFTESQSQELWKYMGEPLPDFGYKWPQEYR